MITDNPISLRINTLLLAIGFLLLFACGKKGGDAPVTPVTTKSAEKNITTFSFSSLSPAVSGTINGTAISLTVPFGTPVSALVPTIAIAPKATVLPASGVPNNFTQPATYTVTAEDGTTRMYTVTVTVTPPATQVVDCANGANIPTTWEDRGDGVDYLVKCNLTIASGTVLTIKPGVRIQFEGAASGFTVVNGAGLKMVGTAEKPIILEGSTSARGSWKGVEIDSKLPDNQWEYVTLRHAGGGTYKAGLLINSYAYFLHDTQLSIKNCTFSNNAGYGIWDYDNRFTYARVVFSAFENNVFSGNELSAMRITFDALGKLDTRSKYSDNGQTFIEITASGGGRNNTTVRKIDAGYRIMENISLYQKMTVEPGVAIEFFTDAGLTLERGGTLIARGTSSSPIRFTGYKAGTGIWLGFSLGNNDPEVALTYCLIDGAGSNKMNASSCVGNVKAALNFYPSCNDISSVGLVSNCTISNSGGSGIVWKKGIVLTLTSNTYSGNTAANEQMY